MAKAESVRADRVSAHTVETETKHTTVRETETLRSGTAATSAVANNGDFRKEDKLISGSSDADKRSNVESLGEQEGDYFNGGHPYYSGTRHLGSNILMLVFCMLGLLATFWALGTYPDGGPWWFAAAIIFYAITFMIPTLILPSKTSSEKYNGVETQLR